MHDSNRDDNQRYDLLISASSRDSAVAIAAEALPGGHAIQAIEVDDVAAREGPGSWQVAIWYSRV